MHMPPIVMNVYRKSHQHKDFYPCELSHLVSFLPQNYILFLFSPNFLREKWMMVSKQVV